MVQLAVHTFWHCHTCCLLENDIDTCMNTSQKDYVRAGAVFCDTVNV